MTPSDEVNVALAAVERLDSEGVEPHRASPRSHLILVHDDPLYEWTLLVRHP
jgi:hypothetical protein